MSNLGAALRTRRTALALTPQQVAARIGYRNVNKGANRVLALEECGEGTAELLARVVVALQLDAAVVEELIAQDHAAFVREWSVWADEVIRPYLVVKLMPGVYQHHALPDAAVVRGVPGGVAA
jgi:hypothetical protein